MTHVMVQSHFGISGARMTVFLRITSPYVLTSIQKNVQVTILGTKVHTTGWIKLIKLLTILANIHGLLVPTVQRTPQYLRLLITQPNVIEGNFEGRDRTIVESVKLTARISSIWLATLQTRD